MNRKLINQIQSKIKKKSCKVVENKLCLSVNELEKQSPFCCGQFMSILFIGLSHEFPLCYVCSSCSNTKPLPVDNIQVPIRMRHLEDEV